MAHIDKKRFGANRDTARGTGGLHRPMRLLARLAAVLSLLLFPAIATAATHTQSPALGIGLASLALFAMIMLVGIMWRRFARQVGRSAKPRWEDWG